MVKKKYMLKETIYEFNQLNDDQKDFIRSCIKQCHSVRMSNYLLTPQQLESYLSLITNVVKEIQQEVDEDKIIKKLILNGFEEDDARLFYDFGNNIKERAEDSMIIKNMNVTSFKCTIDFVIEKMFLYREFHLYSLDYVTHLCNFKNKGEMIKAIRFLYFNVELISTKEVSQETLRSIFEFDYSITGELREIFFQCINEKLSAIYQAQLFAQIEKCSDKIEQLEERFEHIEKYKNDVAAIVPSE